MHEVVETDEAAYLIRPWISYSLYDRMSTRPFLTAMEKLWITYQLVYAMNAAHERGVAHGDLKCENVLVTSSLGVYVSDFASPFKPTFLPLDDPADFSFFFDSCARRTCHIAPERFYESVNELSVHSPDDEEHVSDMLTYELGLGRPNGRVTEAMDVFSLGCVVAELWRDGAPLFSLSQMYRYRAGTFDLEAKLCEIPNDAVRAMVRNMLARNPGERPTLHALLGNECFPAAFGACLHLYLVDLERPGGGRLAPDDRIEKLYEDWHRLVPFLRDVDAAGSDVRLDVYVPEVAIPRHGKRLDVHDDVALILLDVVLANVRHCQRPSSTCDALALLIHMTWAWLPDDARLDRVVPYLVTLLDHAHARVRSMSLHALGVVLECTSRISHINERLVLDVLGPPLATLVHDASVPVRCMLTTTLTRVAVQTVRLWIASAVALDANLCALEAFVYEQVSELIADASPSVRRTCLANMEPLCMLLGERMHAVLPHILTYLNDDDVGVRMAFFDAVVHIAHQLGGETVDTCIHPLVVQALGDECELVQVCALRAFCKLVPMLSGATLWELVQYVTSLLAHPNAWVREASVGVLVRVAEVCGMEAWVRLYPAVRPHLACDIKAMTQKSIREALAAPIPDAVIAACVAAIQREDRVWVSFWRTAARSAEPNLDMLLHPPARPPAGAATHTNEERAMIKHLTDLGLDRHGPPKVAALWWYMERVAAARATVSQAPRTSFEAVQRTVFFTPRTHAATPSTFSLRTAEKRLQAQGAQKCASAAQAPAERAFTSPPSERSVSPAPVPVQRSASTRRTSKASERSERSIKLPFVARATAATSLVHAHAECARPELLGEKPALPPLMNTYDGVDPYIHAHLHAAYEQLQRDAPGPVPQVRIPRVSVSNQRPQGALIACMTEHRGGITALSTAHDQTFFVSASHDTTVKVWDTARLEKHVNSRSRLTYATHKTPVTSVLVLSGTHCVVSASMDGAIHAWGVPVTHDESLPRYARPVVLGKHTLEGAHVRCMTQWTSGSDPLVLLGTSHGRLVMWDVRHMREVRVMTHPPQHGAVTAVCVDPHRHWVCAGTACGHVVLWDARFHVMVRVWEIGEPVRACVVHPADDMRVVVAGAACVEVDLRGEIRSMLEVKEGAPCAGATHEPPPTGDDEGALSRRAPRLPAQGTYALLTDPAAYVSTRGWIVTGGADRIVRFWDIGQADRCMAMGPTHGEFTRRDDVLTHTVQAIEPRVKRTPLHIYEQSRDDLCDAAWHTDAITSLALIEAPYRCIVAGDRSGAIRVWE